ncbi:MAG: hypothetical protein WCP32_08350 [Bacteroidota bacterium]
MTDRVKRNLPGIKSFRSWIVNYLLNLFSLPRVGEEVGKLAGMCINEAGRFSAGLKGEALETKDTFAILAKYIKKEHITRAEKKRFKIQIINMLKGTGVVIPVMLIPLPFISTLLLVLMDHLLLSMNIRILPSSFYPPERKGLMTREGVEKDLEITFRSY